MADYTPLYTPGAEYSATTSAAVVGGTLAGISGSGTVATAGAGAVVIGVFAFDAPSGTRVTIHHGKTIQEVTTGATVTFGDGLKAAAGGTVVPWVSGTDSPALLMGHALTSAGSAAKVTYISR